MFCVNIWLTVKKEDDMAALSAAYNRCQIQYRGGLPLPPSSALLPMLRGGPETPFPEGTLSCGPAHTENLRGETVACVPPRWFNR